MQNAFLIELGKLIQAIEPQNISGTAVNSLGVHLNNARRCEVMINCGAWAGGTSAVTLNQATDVGLATNKAVAFTDYYTSLTTADAVTKNTATANTFTLGTAHQVVVIPIHAQDLDIAGGYGWLYLSLASPGSNVDLVSASFILYDMGYSSKPVNLPSALV